MTRDEIVLACVVVAFATLVTAHVTLVWGLAHRRPWWRGLVALVAVPLAPWWGWREKMKVRGAVWVVAAIAYGVAFGLALR